MKNFQINELKAELSEIAGIPVSVYFTGNKYTYCFNTTGEVTYRYIFPHELEIDRQRSFIRIVRDRHPELFL